MRPLNLDFSAGKDLESLDAITNVLEKAPKVLGKRPLVPPKPLRFRLREEELVKIKKPRKIKKTKKRLATSESTIKVAESSRNITPDPHVSFAGAGQSLLRSSLVRRLELKPSISKGLDIILINILAGASRES